MFWLIRVFCTTWRQYELSRHGRNFPLKCLMKLRLKLKLSICDGKQQENSGKKQLAIGVEIIEGAKVRVWKCNNSFSKSKSSPPPQRPRWWVSTLNCVFVGQFAMANIKPQVSWFHIMFLSAGISVQNENVILVHALTANFRMFCCHVFNDMSSALRANLSLTVIKHNFAVRLKDARIYPTYWCATTVNTTFTSKFRESLHKCVARLGEQTPN